MSKSDSESDASSVDTQDDAALSKKVIKLANLTDADVAEMTTIGVENPRDLTVLNFEDLPKTINVVKRRKLEMIGAYLAQKGNSLSRKTMGSIQKNFPHKMSVSKTSPSVNHAPSYSSSTDRNAPKITTNPLPKFSGKVWDYEEWERDVCSTLGQTTLYSEFLTRPPQQSRPDENARDKEFFNMILASVGKSSALNIVEKSRDLNGESGHAAWLDLYNWYNDASRVDTMIQHWEAKLNSLFLDEDTSATDFINFFEMWVRKIEKMDGAWSDSKKKREIKSRIKDEAYETEVRTHTGTYQDLIDSLRIREQELLK